jgi:hypothetical protein
MACGRVGRSVERLRAAGVTIPWLAVQFMCTLGWVGVATSLGG